jgi:type II secretory pathway component PulK
LKALLKKLSLRGRRNRRGLIFIIALGVIIILAGLVLSFAQNMRSEATASANRLSQLQADAIELGAEQWMMAQVDLNASSTSSSSGAGGTSSSSGTSTPDSWTLVYNTPAEAVQTGNGYFWLIRPNENSDQEYDYGIQDESGKLNLNVASLYTVSNTTSTSEFSNLPTNVTQDIIDAMADWMNPEAKASTDGAETDYYNGLAEPYDAKNQPFETVDELLLVRGVTLPVLYGFDLNRDGVVTDAERTKAQSDGQDYSAVNDTRGIARYLTVFSSGGTALQTANAGGGGGGGRGGGRTGGGGGGAAATTTTPKVGLVNLNTASENVMMAMGLTQQQADAIMTARTGAAMASLADVQQALSGASPPATFLQQSTLSSYQYSADIVAVSGDGRAYKRVKIVVDCTQTPCKIIYRRDLTGLGWPLDEQIRTSLRSGQGIQPGTAGSNVSSMGTH